MGDFFLSAIGKRRRKKGKEIECGILGVKRLVGQDRCGASKRACGELSQENYTSH